MEIQETGDGLIVSVSVKPGSGRFAIITKGDEIILEVRSPPQEGKANQEIVRELPKLLRCDVRILRGEHRKKKLLLLKGISEQELRGVLDTR